MSDGSSVSTLSSSELPFSALAVPPPEVARSWSELRRWRWPTSAWTRVDGTTRCACRFVGSMYLWCAGLTTSAQTPYTDATERSRSAPVSRARRRMKRVSSSQSMKTRKWHRLRSSSEWNTISPSTSTTISSPRGGGSSASARFASRLDLRRGYMRARHAVGGRTRHARHE
eukprot:3973958-Prymnesium_polylepis.1